MDTVPNPDAVPGPSGWIYRDNIAAFVLPIHTAAATECRTEIRRLLQPQFERTAWDTGERGNTMFIVKAGYTTDTDRINMALAEVTDHYACEPVQWFSGPLHTPHIDREDEN